MIYKMAIVEDEPAAAALIFRAKRPCSMRAVRFRCLVRARMPRGYIVCSVGRAIRRIGVYARTYAALKVVFKVAFKALFKAYKLLHKPAHVAAHHARAVRKRGL